MNLTSSALAAALAVAIAAPSLARTSASGPNSPPDIVLRCKQKTQDGKDVPSAGPPETVMIWSKAGVMSWPRGGRDSRFPARVQPGTIFYDEPLNDGHRAGQIDRQKEMLALRPDTLAGKGPCAAGAGLRGSLPAE